ncbi:MAG: hypothetical protein KDI09_14875 [Halioglobus sp.]|nr:hypothetical protein [Halioglobus sp.]
MAMRASLKVLAAVLGCAVWSVLLSTSVRAIEGQPDVIGSAYDESGQELLYRELHFCSDSQLQCSVDYRDPAGTGIAFKELDYSPGPHQPALVMRDLRNELEHVVSASGNEVVVDAGFDNYVRSRWDELSAGEPVRFRFKVVDFDDPIPMKALQQADCAEERLCLKVTVDSWLLGFFADPIELTYARDSKRLLRFRGVSNLRGPNGESQTVDIRYTYPDSTG